MIKKSLLFAALWTLVLSLTIIVSGINPCFAAPPQQKNIILATTTSTQDSGLLDVLIPIFEKQTGYFVKTIAVGSGQAMAMGRRARRTCFWFTPPTRRRNSWRRATASSAGW